MDKNISNIKKRVVYFAKSQGFRLELFFSELDITYGSFKGNQINTSVKSDFIDRFLSKYENVNPYWLIQGKGDMLVKQEALHGAAEPTLQHETNNTNNKAIEDIIADKVMERLEPIVRHYTAIDTYLAEKYVAEHFKEDKKEDK